MAFICLWVCSVVGAEVRVPEAGTVTFKFDPPNESVILEKSERTRVRASKDGSSVYGTDRDEMIREWMFQAVGNGYRVASIVRASREEIDKKPFDNPLKRVIQGKTNLLVISQDGDFLSHEGPDLVSEIKARMPTNLHERISREFNHDMVQQEESERWRFQVKRFLGRTVHEGDTWKEQIETSVRINGKQHSRKHYLLTKIESISWTNGTAAVTVVTMDSTLEQDITYVDTATMGLGNEVAQFLALDRSEPYERMVQVRIVDPATMFAKMDQRVSARLIRTPDNKDLIERETLYHSYLPGK